ncbi:MAG: hypothetical protein U9N77_11430 [Thermodesulfobacteriota bacterium]|nr:hypothetical protein [Thermodesulfobacteriota bacterium]
MIRLIVKVALPDNTTLTCGEIITTKPDFRGVIKGAFRYQSEYLKHPLAFPIDPVSLPLSLNEFPADRPADVQYIFA